MVKRVYEAVYGAPHENVRQDTANLLPLFLPAVEMLKDLGEAAAADRNTGAVDPEVARTWERYDIRRVLERDWKALAPRLAGKLHVYMGGEDTFYLEGATALLKESLAKLGSDAVVEIFPGKDHGTLMDRRLRERIAREMAEQFRRRQARAG